LLVCRKTSVANLVIGSESSRRTVLIVLMLFVVPAASFALNSLAAVESDFSRKRVAGNLS
jgi:hypothetical protein